MQETQLSFAGLGIAPGILSTLETHNISAPTPIQHQAIPAGIDGKDVIGIAQTGTGKTLAFGIPLVQQIASDRTKQGLILVPTRELALQAEEQISKIAKPFNMRTAILIGGTSMMPQLKALRANPNVIIATPGRLIDHLEQRTLTLGRANIVVLDEADRMLDMGFWPQIKRIIAAVPTERQTMLFSATLSPEIMSLATQHMKLPVRIEVAPPGTTADKVSQEFFIVSKTDKIRLLEHVLAERQGSTIVFSRTKHGAAKITRVLKRMGHTAAEIHSNRSLNQRRDALEGFKSGKYRVLVATDIAARGIDVKGIELVINYDLPQASEDYVHRIGRTARAGADGHAISFAEPSQRREIQAIERLIRKQVPISKLPGDLPEPRPQEAFVNERPQVRGQNRGGYRGDRSQNFSSDRRSSGGSSGFRREEVIGGYYVTSPSGRKTFHSNDPKERQAIQARKQFDRGPRGAGRPSNGRRSFGNRRRFQGSGR